MQLEKIKYSELNSKQKEIYNFQKVAGLLAEYGFNCIKLSDDWQGADFLAYHKDGENTLKVQLKSRLVIVKSYMKKSLHIAFPVRDAWYVIDHDSLIDIVEENTTWLTSESWQKQGAYSSANPNQRLIAALQSAKL